MPASGDAELMPECTMCSLDYTMCKCGDTMLQGAAPYDVLALGAGPLCFHTKRCKAKAPPMVARGLGSGGGLVVGGRSVVVAVWVDLAVGQRTNVVVSIGLVIGERN